jgi:uncharacterized membrane protein YdjX (TVP38/TMEM64 family)
LENIVRITDLITNYLVNCGPILGIFIIIIESFIPPLPLGVFVALNCNAFGLILGVIISWAATIIGCILSYLLFNNISTKIIYKLSNKKTIERIEKGKERIKKISFSGLVLIIALPFSPAFLINILAGVSSISKRKFTMALLIGKISTISFWGIIGKSFIESMTDINALIYIVIALIIAYVLSKIVSKKMNIE